VIGEKSIGDLIKEIQKQQLILPEFQRGYVWTLDNQPYVHLLVYCP
jgi:uncharacterized protein with ParB-like and HNH nuclease domain